MSFRIETTTTTKCSKCGKTLKNERDWALCRRQHLLEYYYSTSDGRRILDDLLAAGFKDKPDPWI